MLYSRLCFIVTVIATMACAEDSPELSKEAQACQKDLTAKMDHLKQWLADKVALGQSDEACKHQELQKLVTDFGMAKIECDKGGNHADFIFPVEQYKAWNVMCPPPPPPTIPPSPEEDPQTRDSAEETDETFEESVYDTEEVDDDEEELETFEPEDEASRDEL